MARKADAGADKAAVPVEGELKRMKAQDQAQDAGIRREPEARQVSEARRVSGMQKEQEAPRLTLEEAFQCLEETIRRLEDESISLDESFQVYQSGMELLKYCNQCIDDVERKILVINEKGELDDF